MDVHRFTSPLKCDEPNHQSCHYYTCFIRQFQLPVWSRKQLNSYLLAIQGLIGIITESGLKRLHEIHARQQIEESEERADAILRQMSDGFWVTKPPDGKIIDANDSLCRMVGYTRNEILNMSVADVEANDSLEIIAQRIQQVMRNGSIHFESRFRRKDGTVIDVDVSVTYMPKRGLLFGFHRDITEPKRAEQALTAEATRRRILIEQSRDGIVVLDQNGYLYESNQKFADMLGYPLEEMHKLNVLDWEFLYPRERVMEMIRSVDEKGDYFETQHRRRDGSIYDVEISTNAAWFAGQKLIFCVCRDITERKRAEEALHESEAKFRAIFENSVDAIGVSKAGTHLFVNPAYLRLFGYANSHELIGTSVLNLIAPDSRDQIIQYI